MRRGGEGQRRENGESTYHAFSTPQKKCQKPLGYLYRRKIHTLASTLGRLSSAMRACTRTKQEGDRGSGHAIGRVRQRRAAQVGERIVSSRRLQVREERANGNHVRSAMPTIGGRLWASCMSHSGRLLGACETHTATRVGRRYGQRSGVGLWKRRDALARVGVVHVMHAEARLFPDSWGRPIASCLLRSGIPAWLIVCVV